jgi:hypothetical protein
MLKSRPSALSSRSSWTMQDIDYLRKEVCSLSLLAVYRQF